MPRVKRLLKADEMKVYGSIPLVNLLQDVAEDEDLLDCVSSWSKPCLLFPQPVVHAALYSADQILSFPSTLLAIGSNVAPLQFPHCCRISFFGILHISPCFHCSGTFSSCQIRSNRRLSSTQVLSASAFNSYAVIWSFPGAFPFLRACTSFPS